MFKYSYWASHKKVLNFDVFKKKRLGIESKPSKTPKSQKQLKSLTNLALALFEFYRQFFSHTGFNIKSKAIKPSNGMRVMLNYKRRGLFPSLLSSYSKTIWFFSLGMINARYISSRNRTRKKLTYIKSAVLMRRLLIYSGLRESTFVIKRIPIYLSEIMSTLFRPGVTIYKHPFSINRMVDDKQTVHQFRFNSILFVNNKPYGYMKARLRGRLKRKISRKIILKNRILD